MSRLHLGLTALMLAVVAGVSGCATFQGTADEEDRPPILVNNGSIVFESGSRGRPGRAWQEKNGVFYPDHESGRQVSAFQLYFTGGTGECRPARTNSFTVAFDHDGDSGTSAKPYTATIRAPGSGRGRPGPAVTGEGLRIDSANQRRILAWEGKGAIVDVSGDDFTCEKPTEVWVESIR